MSYHCIFHSLNLNYSQLSNIEMSKQQAKLFTVLQQGNEALKQVLQILKCANLRSGAKIPVWALLDPNEEMDHPAN